MAKSRLWAKSPLWPPKPPLGNPQLQRYNFEPSLGSHGDRVNVVLVNEVFSRTRDAFRLSATHRDTVLLASALAAALAHEQPTLPSPTHGTGTSWARSVTDRVVSALTGEAFNPFADPQTDPLPALLDKFHHSLAIDKSKIDRLHIDGLINTLVAALASNPRALADGLVGEWLQLQSPDVLWPLPEVINFMLEAIEAPRGARVRCLGPGAEPLALECMRARRVPALRVEALPPMTQAYSMITGANAEFALASWAHGSEEIHWASPVKAEIVVPKLGVSIGEFEQHRASGNEPDLGASEWSALDYAARTDCAAVLVTNRILYSRSPPETSFRRRLIESGTVRAIVSFPPGALTAPNFPCAIFLFDREQARTRKSTVLCRVDSKQDFIFETGKIRTRDRRFSADRILGALRAPLENWSRVVSHEEIANDGYILQVERYLDSDLKANFRRAARNRSIVTLADIATVTKAQTLRSSPDSSGVEVREVSPSEFPDFGYLTLPVRQRRVDADDLRLRSRQIVASGDVLLTSKGAIGRVALCSFNRTREPVVASPSTVVLRLLSKGPFSDAAALLMYLRSPMFQAQLRAIVVGTTIPNLSLPELRDLPVAVPTSEEQHALRVAFEAQAARQEQIRELQQAQANLELEVWSGLGLAAVEAAT